MKLKTPAILSIILLCAACALALEPNEILVIANSDIASSVELAKYYCSKRSVPAENILTLPLGTELNDDISREDYNSLLAGPIREKLTSCEFAGKIRCLLTTYGVPFRVQGRGIVEGSEKKLKKLQKQLEKQKISLKKLQQDSPDDLVQREKQINSKIAQIQSAINPIIGKETNASVDSELSMLLFDEYELYRWQPNRLRYNLPFWDYKSFMVSRLDGPGYRIASSLINKAMAAERNGLKGNAYVDSGYSITRKNKPIFERYDKSLRDLVVSIMAMTKIPVKRERTEKLFEPGSCPNTALYCGWYSLKKYVDAFDFVDGAIGYHISSFEAVSLRDPNSLQWCPAMLRDGITATLGAVAEPYLESFPEPDHFFNNLFEGQTLVEAYYHAKPFNSWQLVLIGDPLYKPFKKP
ncbi:MAG: TIGR03790 family protein [Planctomycetota bacterium]|jgi:uncharacterized protein (TIGR03790 family)